MFETKNKLLAFDETVEPMMLLISLSLSLSFSKKMYKYNVICTLNGSIATTKINQFHVNFPVGFL